MAATMNRITRLVATIVLSVFLAAIILVVLQACVSQTVSINSDECVEGEMILLNKQLCEAKE